MNDMWGEIFLKILDPKTVRNFVSTCRQFLEIGRKWELQKMDQLARIEHYPYWVVSQLPNGMMHGLCTLLHMPSTRMEHNRFKVASAFFGYEHTNSTNVTHYCHPRLIGTPENLSWYRTVYLEAPRISTVYKLFVRGFLEKLVVFDTYSRMHEYREYKRSVLHGLSKTFDREGCTEIVCTYRDGKLDGEFSVFYANGQLAEHGFHEAGRRVGVWRSWWPDGTICL